MNLPEANTSHGHDHRLGELPLRMLAGNAEADAIAFTAADAHFVLPLAREARYRYRRRLLGNFEI